MPRPVPTVRRLAEEGPPRAGWDTIGKVTGDGGAVARHLDAIFALPVIDAEADPQAEVPCRARLRARGAVARPCWHCSIASAVKVDGINLETDGRFPREPEPIPENLGALGELVRRTGADLGMAVDPDVDRLALVDETGAAIGEDYTLALAVRAVLARQEKGGKPPVVVANLSTSLVVEDAAREGGARFVRAPVGEANVARAILDEGAVIGGEGNGGVILPALHVGRDAPLGAALILQYLATSGRKLSELVAAAPRYVIVKAKAPRGGDWRQLYQALREASLTPSRMAGTACGWRGRTGGCTCDRRGRSRSSG